MKKKKRQFERTISKILSFLLADLNISASNIITVINIISLITAIIRPWKSENYWKRTPCIFTFVGLALLLSAWKQNGKKKNLQQILGKWIFKLVNLLLNKWSQTSLVCILYCIFHSLLRHMACKLGLEKQSFSEISTTELLFFVSKFL